VVVNRVHAQALAQGLPDAARAGRAFGRTRRPGCADRAPFTTRRATKSANAPRAIAKGKSGVYASTSARAMTYTEVPALDSDVHDLRALAEVSGYAARTAS